jgi:LacI family transcriptional regulator
MARRLKIALLVESSRASLREMLRGIADYARLHGPWTIYHFEETSKPGTLTQLKRWGAQGIIAPIKSPKQIEQLTKLDLPVVDTLGQYEVEGIPEILCDERAVAELAAQHLLERGFEHFGFCGLPGLRYSLDRCTHFAQILAEAGYETSVYNDVKPPHGDDIFSMEFEGKLHQNAEAFAQWIGSLPKPLGLMACNDARARQVVDVCTEYGLAVPEEIAVIGVDDDDLICELSDPTLSSVRQNSQKHGYEAAALLHRMIVVRGETKAVGKSYTVEKSYIEPLGIVMRKSTDVLAIPDREVAVAVHFIREHFADGISVTDVLERVPLSRSTLERRFTKTIGRSPKAEILRVQLNRVRDLLAVTDFPVSKIADLTGFNYVAYMCNAFKEKTGLTPGQFRRKTRSGEIDHV